MKKLFRVIAGVAVLPALSMFFGSPAYGQLLRPRQPVNPPVVNPPVVNPPVANPPIQNPPVQNPAAPPAQNPPPSAVPADQGPAANPPAGPREVREANRDTREQVRDGREYRRDQRRERRSARDLGLNWGRMADRGLAIANLASNGGLYRAGLRADDQIISINGHRIEGAGDFDRYAYTDDPNAQIRIVVWRNGREETIDVGPTVLYADNDTNYTDDLRYFGAEFDSRYPDRLVIVKVYPDTPAFAAGLRVGDEITEWHGEKIHSPRQFEEIIHRAGAGAVDFDYSRDHKSYRGEAKFTERREQGDHRRDEASERRDNEPRTTEPRSSEPRNTEPRNNEPRNTEPRTPTPAENPRVNPNPNPTPREPGREPPRTSTPGSNNPGSTNPGPNNPGSTRPMPERSPGSNPGVPTPREGTNPTPSR